MEEQNPIRTDVDRFIFDEIDSVPHLEALLLLWNTRPRRWPIDELSRYLYIPSDRTRQIIRDLQQHELAGCDSDACFYISAEARDTLIADVDRTWRRELVRISNMIHSKASPAVRDFARAFRFRKDKP
ncbi:MAG TPA: hypothetical protein VHX37_14170 [Acidobacteriaceae bacterium]|jgi:hypothetical protein|nr:hypothetical protein [Acidobacteriaceae bacterium]